MVQRIYHTVYAGAKSFGKIITKKPILPTEEEQRENSRAKSAKLRIFEKKI